MIIVLNSDLFGKNLHFLRTRKKLSLLKTARYLKLSVPQLYLLEKGALLDIDHLVLQKICDLFSTDMQQITSVPLYEKSPLG